MYTDVCKTCVSLSLSVHTCEGVERANLHWLSVHRPRKGFALCVPLKQRLRVACMRRAVHTHLHQYGQEIESRRERESDN
jgi:hypothetical protein